MKMFGKASHSVKAEHSCKVPPRSAQATSIKPSDYEYDSIPTYEAYLTLADGVLTGEQIKHVSETLRLAAHQVKETITFDRPEFTERQLQTLAAVLVHKGYLIETIHSCIEIVAIRVILKANEKHSKQN